MPDTTLPEHVEEHLALAAQGVVRPGLDERWEPILLNVARRGVVTAADRRAARRLLEELGLD
ncbi:hypothetical protein H4J02_00250 [Protaetiibacter sp. SSC-01]|uniref:hypothetical protein n=1 Tax=Protaetiibacter sp. SSC-01 TaxID=2759943 RepID=UPI0016569173|nr:hypothetical protein [Protaetiibacter sp. SSC-01]QNO37524.1 hypothetical protein H4J02_00250 [Protaetiibacter sp. SSC-01]